MKRQRPARLTLAPVLLTLLATAALVVSGTAADAATPRCQGQKATIVGSVAKFNLDGTEHRDVIVTNGSEHVRAKGGDDSICVTGKVSPSVEDGKGDDIIDARFGTTVFADLAGGNDTVLGGGGMDGARLKGGGRDRLVMGGGNDDVSVRSTSPSSTISLGAGDDSAEVQSPDSTLFLDGGPGVDSLGIDDTRAESGGKYIIKNSTGRLRIGRGTSLRWGSFQEFSVDLPDQARLFFTGSALDERLDLPHLGYDGSVPFRVDLGGGDDELTVNGIHSGTIKLGTGHDKLRIDSTNTVDADLEAGMIDTIRPNNLGTTHFEVQGVDDLSTTRVPFIKLTGDGDANRLSGVNVCTSVIHGGGGNDVIDVNATRCTADVSPRHALFGDRGNDEILGTKLDDVLDGGPGNDIADGFGGTDVCHAETTISCELP